MNLAITTSLIPNVLAHIYASADLADMKEYREKYRHTLRNEDLVFLESLLPHLGGKPPMGGPLFLYLYQIPSYFPAETLDEIHRNLDMIIEGLETDWIYFKELDDDTLEALEVWFPRQLFEYPNPEENLRFVKQVKEMLSRLKEIIAFCHTHFYEDYWNELRLSLLKRAGEIRGEIEGLSVFEAWADALSLSFPYKEFVFYLCEARRGGTSLLAEKFALPLNVTMERSIDTIIHEIGIHHIICPKEYLKRGLTVEKFIHNQEKIGRMEEAATCYFKPKVYERLNLDFGEDYHLPLMGIGPEIERFGEVWEKNKPRDAIEGLLMACDLM